MPELEKVKCSTPDFAEETAKKILALLPECAGEGGAVDIDKLKQCLSSKAIEGNVERYEFTWPGKRAAKAAASARTTKTLRPCAAESVGKDGTPGGFDSENLYIEGDNLEVLKLLQTSYANQVKMIYIDPPYNTGHDFVYRDRFSLTQKELESEAGVFDEDGNRFEVNDSAEARYHSNWCSMMYPRLKLARNLLRDDGVIFISLDDNEQTNLRKLCDEIFGENNFVGDFIWRKKDGGGMATEAFVIEHEHISVYRKSEAFVWHDETEKRDEAEFKKEDERGKFKITKLAKWGNTARREDRPTMYFPIKGPDGSDVYPIAPDGGDGRWRVGAPRMKELFDQNLVHWEQKNGAWIPYEKEYFGDQEKTIKARSILYSVANTGDGTNALTEIFGKKDTFENPKPVELINTFLVGGAQQDNALVLDFFSGSATTAHAVMRLNAEDGANRKFILVQLPEPCAEGSEAAKAGFKNICEIGKERMRRAGKKIREDNAEAEMNLDIGFRVLKLDTSSLRDTASTVGETTQEFANFEHIKSDRSPEDLLFQMLLETRISLSDQIETRKVGGNNVFFVSDKALVACLDPAAKMTTDFFIEIAKMKPGIAFFRDDAFADDSARTNLQQAFDQFSPTTSIKVI